MEMSTALETVDWEQYAIDYDLLLELTPYQKLLESIIGAAKIEAHASILDAGCGTGNIVSKIEKLGIPLSVLGVDRSQAMLKRAMNKCQSNFAFSDLNKKLKFPSNSFDRIICSNALYPVREPSFTLNEFFRVLKPRGRVVVANPKTSYENGLILKEHAKSTKPNSYWRGLHSSEEREQELVREAIKNPKLAQAMLDIARVNRSIAHANYHFFTKSELRSVMEKAGFKVVKIEPVYAKQNYLIVAEKEADNEN